MFQANPSTFVNQQLWTVPFEMECYMVLAVLAVLGIASRRWLLLVAMALLQVTLVVRLALHGPVPLTLLTGHVLVGCFLAGLVFYKFRDRVPHSVGLFVGCLAAMAMLLAIPGGDQFIFIPAAYVTVWLGTLNSTRNRLLFSGDYSYGLFLYGFPIQQAFTALGPWTRHWWLNMAVAYPAAFVFAAFSWWCIERPALGLKRHLVSAKIAALRFPPLKWHSDRVFRERNTTFQ